MSSHYELLKQWNELLKSGTITQEEFNTLKNELLNTKEQEPKKISIEKNDVFDTETTKSQNEPLVGNHGNTPNNNQNNGSQTKLILLIGLIILLVGGVGIGFYFYSNSGKSTANSEENYDISDENSLNDDSHLIHYNTATAIYPRVYFYKQLSMDSRSNSYIVDGQTAEVLEDLNEFIKVRFEYKGNVTIGYLLKDEVELE